MANEFSDRLLGRKPPITFFVLVFLMSTPFWVLAAVTEQALPEETSINLPISSLMALCPITAASILVYREAGSGGAKELLKRSFDHKRIKRKIWYVPIFLLMPIVMVLVSVLKNGMQVAVPHPQFPVAIVLIFPLIFIEALVEEVGWQGYAFDPMQDRWNALRASIILGIVWAAWHTVPFIQTNPSANWVTWQSMNLVVTRIIIVWIYNNTGGSVFAAIVYHAMNNVSTILLQDFGWVYDPVVTTIILAAIALIVIFLWGPKTLARYRYAG